MAALSTSVTSVSDNEAIVLDLERLMHIACFNSRVPIALLILHQTSVYRIVCQVGWALEQSLESLAEPLFHAVQAGSPGHPKVVQESSDGVLLPNNKLTTFLPPLQFWAGIPVQAADGQQKGALIVLDTVPHRLLPQQIDALQLLAQTLSPYLPIDAPVTTEAQTSIPPLLPSESGVQEISVSLTPPPVTKPLEAEILRLQEENCRLQLVQNLSLALQACESLDEVYAALPNLLGSFCSGMSGQILLINCQQGQIAQTIYWGKSPYPTPPSCAIPDCSAIHTQQPHECKQALWVQSNYETYCTSATLAQDPAGQCCFCSPIATLNGQTFGVLSLWHPVSGERISETDQRSIVAIAQHIAFTLERLEQIENLRHKTIRDPLTGLFNRLYLKEILPQLLHRAERNHQPISVVMIDIDHFKRFNDQHGHQAGDQVLRDFSVFLKGFVRATDLACRYGGEEFILILPNVCQSKARQIADRIRHGLQYVTLKFAGRELGSITLSAGIASFPQNGVSDEELIAAADAALYQAKTHGRNRVRIAAYQENMPDTQSA
ncbi:GGDEF domain-containing protein [Vacuolonema iberomarrocanum]|uniref:GGDEF domain-containing protein n=1 Tax=Vacuolonema iberomarrocanum TaxID=3454632 RepID=UPI0019F72FA4|nr:GGDEF domain-containing protein [filamentous cyanobacterium LEGE 07170]